MISVIALLIALLLPVMGHAREQARRVMCASNLRQLGLGVHQYAMDNAGELPGSSGYEVHSLQYFRIADEIRKAGIPAQVYLGSGGIGAQIKYADRRCLPAVVIAGEDEMAAGTVCVS